MSNTGRLCIVSIYPEKRKYASGIKPGDNVAITVAPYETLALEVSEEALQRNSPDAIPEARSTVGCQVSGDVTSVSLKRFTENGGREPFGPNWTKLSGDGHTAEMRLDAKVEVKADEAKLLVLLEGSKTLDAPLSKLIVNDRPIAMTSTSSDTGWSDGGTTATVHWLFLEAPLKAGANRISLDCRSIQNATRISAWVYVTKPGKPADGRNLSEPEIISLDSLPLLPLTEVASIANVEKSERRL